MKETLNERCDYPGHTRRPKVYNTDKTVWSKKLKCYVTYDNKAEVCLTCISIKRKIKRGTLKTPVMIYEGDD